MVEPIIVVKHDPQWARIFQEDRAQLLDALSGLQVQIEHVGSTAVPGLDAKPIIDILIIVQSEGDAIRSITPLVRLEYVCIGENEIPGRIYFRRGEPQTHHIHLYVQGNPEIERHLHFRDYLRAHPEVADAYARLKYELAVKFREDRIAYTNAKTDFVIEIEERARREFAPQDGASRANRLE